MFDHLHDFWQEQSFVATGAVFAVNALLFALWVTRIPEIMSNLSLSEAQLGGALFCIPAGALLAMTTISRWIDRHGAGRVTIWTTAAYLACISLPFTVTSLWQLGIALFFVGLTMGAMDIAMNAVAAILERDRGKIIMATCHGFFSLGGMIGALLGSLGLALSLDALQLMLFGVGITLFGVYLLIRPILYEVKDVDRKEGSAWVWPERALAGLAVIGFCSMQGEGAIVDWSAVFLDNVAQAEKRLWGLGYAGFSLSMTVGRFLGDGITHRVGAKSILRWSFVVVVVGLGIVLVGRPWLSIMGFTFAGAGYALLVPIVFSEAARISTVSSSQGIASVATVGYMGFLLGPVFIGGIAEVFDLRMGFVYLVLLTILAWLVSTRQRHDKA